MEFLAKETELIEKMEKWIGSKRSPVNGQINKVIMGRMLKVKYPVFNTYL